MYDILDGVRRAVAARELGLTTIEAVVLRDGKTIARKRITLVEILSPKD